MPAPAADLSAVAGGVAVGPRAEGRRRDGPRPRGAGAVREGPRPELRGGFGFPSFLWNGKIPSKIT